MQSGGTLFQTKKTVRTHVINIKRTLVVTRKWAVGLFDGSLEYVKE